MEKLQRHLLLSVLLLLCASSILAQNSKPGKSKEIYLNGNLLTFSNFGLQYKSQLKNNSFFRLGLTSLNSYYNKSNYGTSTIYNTSLFDMSGSIDIGLEKRKTITDKLTAFCGINLYTGINFDRNKTENPSLPLELRHEDGFDINSGFGFDTGLILRIIENFSISAEIMPRLLINYNSNQNVIGTRKVTDTHTGGSFNFNSSSVRVSFVYNWTKI